MTEWERTKGNEKKGIGIKIANILTQLDRSHFKTDFFLYLLSLSISAWILSEVYYYIMGGEITFVDMLRR